MSACTFFGHRDCPELVRPLIREEIKNLIEKKNVDTFYVGNQGRFDALVRSVLREMKCDQPGIKYAVVLAYYPATHFDNEYTKEYQAETLFPEGIENVPKRFAIPWRNRWMISQSEYVIAYVTRSWGGAAAFTRAAKQKGCTVISLK